LPRFWCLDPAKVIGNTRTKIFSDGSPARGRLSKMRASGHMPELELVRDYARSRQVAGDRVPPLGAEHDDVPVVVIEGREPVTL
jgi:hypothetical protein